MIGQTKKNKQNEIVLDEQGQLFYKWHEYTDFTSFLVQSFDLWVTDILPKQIMAKTLKTDISVISFRNIFFQSAGKLGDPSTYPNDARLRDTSYLATGYFDIIERFNNNTEETEHRVMFGQIPVMLGSCLCVTRQLNAAERHKIGENYMDPDGYFIIKGNERLVIIQEKLRMNKILLYYKDNKGTLLCTMTCATITGSHIINVLVGKNRGLKLHIKTFGAGKHVPVLLLYKFFGYTNIEDILAHLFKFTTSKDRNKILQILVPSVFKYETTEDVYQYIHRKSTESSKIKEETWEDDKQKIKQDVISGLFPHMNGEPFERKLDMLAMMIMRVVEFKIGSGYLDDRDSWGNKRLEASPRMMESLFTAIWDKIIDSIQTKLDTERTGEHGIGNHLMSVKKHLTTEVMKEDFVNSFAGQYWGLKNNKSVSPVSRYKQNMTDILKRDAHLSAHSHMRRVSATTNKQTKQASIRLVPWSGLGAICPAETPEGGSCGLVKNMASTCWTSLERDDAPVIDYLNGRIVSDKTEDCKEKVLLNGRFIGWTNGSKTETYLRKLKVSGNLYYDICIILEKSYLTIYTDASRVLVPLLIVKDNEIVLDRVIRELGEIPDFPYMLSHGIVEYVDIAEHNMIDLVFSKQHLADRLRKEPNLRVTHCDLDPTSMLSISTNIIPFAHMSQAPRNTYQASMGKQALGTYHTNHKARFDTTARIMVYPNRPIFEPQMNKLLGLNEIPAGQMVRVAIMTHEGWEQEDALVVNRHSIDCGMFFTVKYFTKIATISKDHGKEIKEAFGIPPVKLKGAKSYSHLDENGLPVLGSFVQRDDCIIGKVRHIGKDVKDVSMYLGVGECGIVDRVTVIQNAGGVNQITIKVKIREFRVTVTGDKYASRYAQKATIGKIREAHQMPFTDKGVCPDVIINPIPIAKRMTINKVNETIISKGAALKGEYINATTFRSQDVEYYAKVLEKNGFNFSGEETMYDGMTGKKIQAKIYNAPCYYQALRHQVKDKIQVRGLGFSKMTTRQPTCGRHEGGALRLGNMERDALISHGASAMLLDRMCYCSDPFTLVICIKCGHIGSAIQQGMAMFPCKACHNTKFGRVKTSYVFKYLIHILAAANINVKPEVDIIDEVVDSSSIIDIEDMEEPILVSDEEEDTPNEQKKITKEDEEEEEDIDEDIVFSEEEEDEDPDDDVGEFF
jgi:DNA-directed RNA polymerase II subunit RPB2